MKDFSQFNKQQYLNIETYRKNGEGVRTPVWFVQDGNCLYVRTMAESGKVKRIRNHPLVKIAPCKVNGNVTGEWVPTTAQVVTDEGAEQKVDRLLDRKYGLMKKLFGLSSAYQKGKSVIIELRTA